MSGLEALGATASVIQLLDVCVKCSRAASQIIRSYRDAPKELKDLAMKVEMLKFRIENVQKIGDDLSSIDTDDLLPEIHRDILLEQLQQYLQLLGSINRAYPGVRGQTRGAKMQWALFDKAKSGRVMRDLKDVNETLDQVLSIVSLRLATVQQNSLLALRVSSAAMLPALEFQTRELQLSIDAATERQTVLLKQTRTELTQCFMNATEPRSQYVTKGKLGMQSSPSVYQEDFHRLEKSTTGPKSYSRASEESTNDNHDYVNDLVNMYDSGLETLHSSSWTFRSRPSAEEEPRRTGRLSLKSNKYYRDFRVSLQMRLFLLNERILSFELGLRQFTRAWASIATTDCRISVANIRPADSPIFALCDNLDFEGVKNMLDEGQASIYDVDDISQAGLLDYTMSSRSLAFENGRQLKLFHYLLLQGCNSANYMSTTDSDLFLGRQVQWSAFRNQVWLTAESLPAIFSALKDGQTEIVRLMLRYGVTFDTHQGKFMFSHPIFYIDYKTLAVFREQLAFLSSLGFVYPNSFGLKNSSLGHILSCAIALGSLSDVTFCIEVLKIDVENLEPEKKNSYLAKLRLSRTAPEVGFAAALHEYGLATIFPNCRWKSILSIGFPFADLSHWTLFNDTTQSVAADNHEIRASINDGRHRPWSFFWLQHQGQEGFTISFEGMHAGMFAGSHANSWKFGSTVMEAAHLLLHRASWSQVLAYDSFFWTTMGRCIRRTFACTSFNIAKAWGDVSARLLTKMGVTASAEEPEEVDAADFHIAWSNDGTITRTRCLNGIYRTGSKVEGQEPGEMGVENENPNSCHICSKNSHTEEDQNTPPTDALLGAAISTPQGRRQMQRYPLVKALSYALQLAGYRVEMDDEGDLWFDDDDGDPYSDAVEHIQDLDKTGPLGGTCPICRDPEAYGLGHVLDRAEDGLVEWRRERQKFVDRGALRDDGWVWPSWTRRGGRR